MFVVLSFVLLVACKPQVPPPQQSPFRPLQNGFGVVTQPIGVDTGPGAKLYYKGTNEPPVLVWPYIGTHGYPILYSNDIALLLADNADAQGRLVLGALIVVQGTGPAMDISDDVLKIASEQTHADFQRALQVNHPLRLNQVEGKIEVYFVAKVGSGGSDLKARITWDDVFEIMRDVKTSGRTNKITNTDVLYLKKNYPFEPAAEPVLDRSKAGSRPGIT